MSRTRQLAAIMFTDIEGYTALMQQNEKEAILTRDKHREIFNGTTAKHNGRVLQYFGDGTLSVFDSAIEAVECGIEMQHGFQRDPAIDVRIGIHIGDIVFSEDEIIGDGVNVAARIESLAVPGSVFISDKVHEEIKNQESITAIFLKDVKFKNVIKPVSVYAISNEGLIVPDPNNLKGKTDGSAGWSKEKKKKHKSRVIKIRTIQYLVVAAILGFVYMKFGRVSPEPVVKPDNSIAVLAFENMSGDADKEYFSDGISEEILNSLAHVKELRVAGRTSSFYFKGKNENIQVIGDKLNVNMVLEGSIRQSGNRVRIRAQLINVEDGFHIWSETYDRELKDVFGIQEEIASEIVEKLKLQFDVHTETEVYQPKMEAYDILLKGVYFIGKDFEGAKQAMDYFQEAIEIDPNYAAAHAWIGDAYINYAVYGLMSSTEAYSNARSSAQRALTLNSNEPRAHKVMAYVHLNYDWDWSAAQEEYDKAIKNGLQNPDHFITLYDIIVHKDFKKSIEGAQEVLDRDPFEIQSHWHLGLSNYFAQNYQEALESFSNALELDPNYSEGHRWKGLALSGLGKNEEALTSINTALEITKGTGPAYLDLLTVKTQMGQHEEVIEVLEQWENSEQDIDPMGPAILYALLNKPDKAVFWLEKAYLNRSFMMVSLDFYTVWDALQDNPGFIEIHEKMNFPNK
ncbi:MAG: TolB-like protein/Tfp pilus assembly protein PilF [Bacteroidia bacterium]